MNKFFTKAVNYIIFVFLFFVNSCFSNNENQNQASYVEPSDSLVPSPEEEWTVDRLRIKRPYDYFDTTLSNGYHLSHDYFKRDNELCRYLTLKKGNEVIDSLNIMGYGIQDKSLGYIGADFKEYFAFVNSFGSGNPHDMKLIRKKDGRVIREGYILRGHKEYELLLYQSKDGQLLVFDIANMKDIRLPHLDYQVMDWQLGELIKFTRVTEKEIVLQYENLEVDSLENIFIIR